MNAHVAIVLLTLAAPPRMAGSGGTAMTATIKRSRADRLSAFILRHQPKARPYAMLLATRIMIEAKRHRLKRPNGWQPWHGPSLTSGATCAGRPTRSGFGSCARLTTAWPMECAGCVLMRHNSPPWPRYQEGPGGASRGRRGALCWMR